jgi:hypothetical protein
LTGVREEGRRTSRDVGFERGERTDPANGLRGSVLGSDLTSVLCSDIGSGPGPEGPERS